MAHVVVIGAGAIGSHLLPHLARSSRVSRITVIDRDRYDESNTRQDIDRRDIGLPKATVQARRLRRINPDISVVPIRAAVEHLPLGRLRGAIICAALDGRRARQVVNQAAWRLGVPWIDAGVHADGLLARVRVFVPADEAPCLECGWDRADYDAIEQTYPCTPGNPVAPTNAPSMLGALAAALQAIECEKMLAGDTTHALVGRDLLLDASHHRHSVASHRRNPACLMPDHAGWRIDPLGETPEHATVEDVLALGSTLRGASASLTFGVAGQRLAMELWCAACEARHATCQLERHTRTSQPRCPQCGERLLVTGFGLHDVAPSTSVPLGWLNRPLSDLGVRPHDVLSLRTPEVEAHLEVRAA